MPTAYPGAPGTNAVSPTSGGASPGSELQRFVTVVKAAQQWHIPPWVLWGVYGKETNFGQNVHTSSKGAVGHFQFLPSTAQSYGYPLTNTPNATDFERQAQAAAHYLHDLGVSDKAARPAIERALQSYSGHGYGYDAVMTAAKSSSKSSIPIIGPAIDAAKNTADAVASAAGDVGSVLSGFFQLITSLEFWLRLGEGIAGLVLIAMGLKSLGIVDVTAPLRTATEVA